MSELDRLQATADRYERTLRAIKDCPLTGQDFGDWVQSACEDVLEGLDPECWNCGTFVHEGPCVSDEQVDECICLLDQRDCTEHGGAA